MTNLNLEWLHNNFDSKGNIFIEIGGADIAGDFLRFRAALPNTITYTFECAEIWKEKNIETSKLYGLNYIHKAVSHYDGKSNFYTADSNITNWEYIGKLSQPTFYNNCKNWNTQFTEVISLNTFFNDTNIIPSFIHIDTEGEEFNILRNLKEKYWPIGIWLEYWPKYHLEKNYFIEFDELNSLMLSRNYKQIYKAEDVLYVKVDYEVTEYSEYDFSSNFEKEIKNKIAIDHYNLIKGSDWPNLNHVDEFDLLPQHIKKEAEENFSFISYNIDKTN